MATILLLMITIVVLVNLTPVQNYLVGRATDILSKKLKTTVKVSRIRIDFLNHLSLQGVLIQDKANDTLVSAGNIQVRISDWFIFKDKPVLHYIAVENTYVHLYRTASSKDWNYDFIADAFSSGSKKNTKDTGSSFEIDLKKVELNNVRFHFDDKWVGEDQDYDIGSLLVDAHGVDFNKKLIDIKEIEAQKASITIREYTGGRPKHLRRHKTNEFDMTPFNPDNWMVNVGRVELRKCEFHLAMDDNRSVPGEFDYNHIDVTGIAANVKDGVIRGDTIHGNLVHLEAKERSGIAIRNMRSKITVSPVASICDELYLETNYSKLQDHYSMHYRHFPNFNDYIDSVVMVGHIRNASIDVRDIAYFAPELKSFPPIVLQVSGDGKGSVADISAEHLHVSDGNSVLRGDVTMKGLPDIYKTYITFTNGELHTTNVGIMRYAPGLKDNPGVDMNSLLFADFHGRYEGYIENFSVEGMFNTSLGSVTANMKMSIPGFDGNKAAYSGTVISEKFQLGTLVKQPLLGSITVSAGVSGSSFNMEKAQLNIDSRIEELGINNYLYHNITAHGLLAKQQFDGSLLVDDPNLALEFDGGINFSGKNINVNATAHLMNCNFKALNIVTDSIKGSADFDLNCTGSNIDNFSGYAKLNNIYMVRNGRRIAIDSVLMYSGGAEERKSLRLESNNVTAAIKGNYRLSNLPASVQYYLSRYLPNYIKTPDKFAPEQNFDFTIATRNIDTVLAVSGSRLRGFDGSTITGSFNTSAQKLTLNADVPKGSIGSFHMNNLSVQGVGNLEALSLGTTIENVVIGDSVINGSLSLTAGVTNDSVTFTVATTTPDPSSSITLNGYVIAHQDSLFLTIKPSQFYMNQVKWDIAGGSKVVYSDNYLSVNGLSLVSGLQRISVATELQTADKALAINTENLDLGQFGSWAGLSGYQPDGRVNGTIRIEKMFKEVLVSANLKATGVKLGTDTVGTVNLIGNYDGGRKLYSLDPQTGIYRGNASVIASGNISFDSATHQKLDGIIQFNNAPVSWASPFLAGVMSHLSGKVNGSINFGGAAYRPTINGNVALSNGGLKVDYLGCTYSIPVANVHIDNRIISFGTVTLLDNFKNTASLTGYFSHNMFKDMRMRLTIRTKKFEIMNLGSNDNNLFYGNIIAGLDSFTIRGPFNNIRLNAYNATPAAMSKMYIPYVSSGDMGTYSYVTFKKYGKSPEQVVRKNKFKIHVNIDANLNTLGEMHIVLDPSTGDEIMTRGDGRIQIDIPSDNDMHTAGVYSIDNGTYTITFKSFFIHRVFQLKPNSTISFNGPFSATSLNVDAVYSTKAKLVDLLSSDDMKNLQSNEIKDAQTPQIVDVLLHMSGELKSPRLTFDMDLPDKHSQSTLAYRKLMLINGDDRQKTEEVAALLMINSFMPIEGKGIGSTDVARGGLNNVSQMLSSTMSTGLTNIVNKLTGDKQLNIDLRYTNYNYSDQTLGSVGRNQVKVAASRSLFNNKLDVEVGGTSDWGRTASAANSSFNFTGNYRVQYKLNYTSGLRLTAFRTSDYDVTIDQNITRTGVGVSWRKSFDNFGEFFRSNRYLSKKKEKEEQEMQDAADTVRRTRAE